MCDSRIARGSHRPGDDTTDRLEPFQKSFWKRRGLHPLKGFAVPARNPSSYLATIVLDLALIGGFEDEYRMAHNDFAAVGALPLVKEVDDSVYHIRTILSTLGSNGMPVCRGLVSSYRLEGFALSHAASRKSVPGQNRQNMGFICGIRGVERSPFRGLLASIHSARKFRANGVALKRHFSGLSNTELKEIYPGFTRLRKRRGHAGRATTDYRVPEVTRTLVAILCSSASARLSSSGVIFLT